MVATSELFFYSIVLPDASVAHEMYVAWDTFSLHMYLCMAMSSLIDCCLCVCVRAPVCASVAVDTRNR